MVSTSWPSLTLEPAALLRLTPYQRSEPPILRDLHELLQASCLSRSQGQQADLLLCGDTSLVRLKSASITGNLQTELETDMIA